MGSKRRRSWLTKELISEGSKKKGKSSSAIDRISELPEPILQHLLCYLSPKDAFRSSTLSKSWRHICSTRPKLELRESFFNGNREAFFSFLDTTLSRYRDQNTRLSEFLLEISSKFDSELVPLLETWIPLVLLGMGVKKFSLKFICNHFFNCDRLSLFHFDLAEIVFKAESLEELHLTGCDFSRINHTNKVMFNHLRKLSLALVWVSEVTLERIISSCPLIEHVAIDRCDGLRTIKVNKAALKLKSFDFVDVNRIPIDDNESYTIEIDVPSIEHITIVDQDWLHSANYLSFTYLKSLHLNSVRLSENSFHRFSVDFCCLEELTLRDCYGFKGFKLVSRSIKNLALSMYVRELRKAAIDVPNIHSFELSCVSLPSFSFTTASSEWKSKISVLSFSYRSLKLLDIYELHKAALCNSQFSLHITIPWGDFLKVEDAISYPPVVIENLTMELKHCILSLGAWLCNLFYLFRPRNLHHSWYANPKNDSERAHNQLVECLRKTLSEDNHQGLEQVLEESSNEDGKEAECGLLDNRKQKIRFRLKWRE